jgi:hypothetical protein
MHFVVWQTAMVEWKVALQLQLFTSKVIFIAALSQETMIFCSKNKYIFRHLFDQMASKLFVGKLHLI